MHTQFHDLSVSEDTTGINYRSLNAFLLHAREALLESGEEEAAHYFEMFQDFLQKDVVNGAPFVFTYRSLGM
jgi:hypothetical protein